MKILSVSFRLATLLVLSAMLIPETPAAADDAAPLGDEKGIEVLARGPVHEAFADPGAQQAKPSPIIPKQPPKDIEELPPEQKPAGNNVQWIGGFWAFDDEAQDFIWVSGFWRDLPPGRQWMPGYWTRLADGWQWVAGFWAEAGQKNLQFLPQPPASLDNGPSVPQPGEDYSYAPGSWVYRENRYLWSPGFWQTYSPSWIWCPGRYVWTPSGYLYLNGYYDYPLENRGLLFAPVCFNEPLWDTPGWCYRPRWSICAPALFSCLWARPNYGCYWFGDYFGSRYDRQGFRPWYDNRFSRYGYDPLYSHYRQRNRNDGRWENELQSLYADRRAGNATLPPRNLLQQRQLANDPVVARDGGRGGARIRDLTVLAPLQDAERLNGVKLQAVSTAKQAEQKDTIEQVRAVREQRQKIDRDIQKEGAPTRLSDAPRLANVDLPKVEAGLKTPVTPAMVRNAKEERRAGVQEPVKPLVLPPLSENKTPAAVNKPLETKPLPSRGITNPVEGKPGRPLAGSLPDHRPPQVNLPGENKAPVPPVPLIRPPENKPAENKPPVAVTKPSENKPPVPLNKLPDAPPVLRSNPAAENKPPVAVIKPPEIKPPSPPPALRTPAPVAPAVLPPSPPPALRTPPPAPVAPSFKPPSPPPAPVIRTPPPAPAPVIRTPPPAPAPVIRTPPPAPAPAIRTPPPAPAPVIRTPPPAPAPVIRTPPPAPAVRPPAPAPQIRSTPPAPRPAPAARPAPPPPISRAAPPAQGGGKKK